MAMTEEAKNITTGSGGTGSKQMSAKRGIKLFGERAVAAIYKEHKLYEFSVCGSSGQTTRVINRNTFLSFMLGHLSCIIFDHLLLLRPVYISSLYDKPSFPSGSLLILL